MTNEFNLRELIRDVCENSTTADPVMLAKEVNHRIKRGDRDTALEQALPTIVQQVISRRVPFPLGDQANSDNQRYRVAEGYQPSRKVARIREAWKRALRNRVAVAPDMWKFLADCTIQDLDYAASIREEHAKRNVATAARYRALAELMTEHKALTVAALPETILAPALGDAA